MTWITDNNDNRCSIEYWGTEEAARQALSTLINCSGCSDCSLCSDCSRCSGCSDCSGCSRCSGCSDCSLCSDCSRCSRCSGCSDCSLCSDCSGCSGCSGCSRCSRCSGCSGCSGCSLCLDKQDNIGDFQPPVIPKLENIHQQVLAAGTATPKSLAMDSWHKCQTTHCRAGWVVHLAGESGYALERYHGTALAAQLIYRESNPALPVSPPRFYETNDQALADMRRMAELEGAA